jgi:hypothetical protein
LVSSDAIFGKKVVGVTSDEIGEIKDVAFSLFSIKNNLENHILKNRFGG